jgi:hypothetical protein
VFGSVPQDLCIRSGFVGGLDTLEVVVNNTGDGILGTPIPVDSVSPSAFGLTGEVFTSVLHRKAQRGKRVA